MAEGQDRGSIRGPITDQLDADKVAHGRNLNQGLLHDWVAERIPLLLQVNPQHRGQRLGRPAALFAGLWVVGLNQIEKGLPGHHYLHLREEHLPFVLLVGGGDLVIRKADLFAANQPSSGLRLQAIVPRMALVFQCLTRAQLGARDTPPPTNEPPHLFSISAPLTLSSTNPSANLDGSAAALSNPTLGALRPTGSSG